MLDIATQRYNQVSRLLYSRRDFFPKIVLNLGISLPTQYLKCRHGYRYKYVIYT